jgi:hypothetical protein
LMIVHSFMGTVPPYASPLAEAILAWLEQT